MGTEQCDLSEKTPQIGSECLGSEKEVRGTVLTNSVIEEKSTSEVLGTLLTDKKSKKDVIGSVLANSVIDEKSNQVSANMFESSITQLPEVPHHCLESSSQTLEGSCLQQSTFEQVSVNISDDKAEDKCPQNLLYVAGEASDAVTALAAEDQTQPVPAEMNTTSVNELLDPPSGDVAKNISSECSEPVPAEVNMNSANEILDPPSGDVAKNISSDCSELVPAEIKTNSANEILDSSSRDVAKNISSDSSELMPAEVNMSSANEILDPPSGDVAKNISSDCSEPVPAEVNTNSANEILDPSSGDVAKNISSDCSERKPNSAPQPRIRQGGKSNSKLLKKYMLRSLGSSDRALRSRDKPKAPEPNNNVVDVNNEGVKTVKGKKKKKKKTREGINDQFSKIRSHLRYLLNRISYEQNLIDAYSGEGWKGYSVEKLKPEKEIERAKSEILRRKLKIRDLFQNLDSLCAEGRLPESLFDSEGEIDSEDIFCAKCQSSELNTDNDIILCDGVCDRGFHQLCLDPPLLTEDIPGDEGWLCPGCDCKDDCLDLVNDFLETKLSLTDSWERVFPEAARAAGSNLDPNSDLPSDDSGDDDYNPNGQEDVEVEGGESSSDESEYASASEKLEDPPQVDQYLGLPSDDSEDNDYDPSAQDISVKVTEESSSSDFTSDSEDLADFKGSGRQKSKVDKHPSIVDELSLLEPDLSQEDFTPASGKRNVERLDYKKLYEETYQSDTSDDEEWTAAAPGSRKKKLTGNMTPVSPNGNTSNNSRHNHRRNTHQNEVENTNNSPTKSREGCVESSSRGKRRGSTYKRLGEDVVQRLYKSFKESQFPDRATKESLAQELGLSYQQVDKWFGNCRWSFRHHKAPKVISSSSNALQQATDSGAENKGEGEHDLASEEIGGEKSKNPTSRKRKRLSDDQESKVELVDDGSPAASSPRADEKKTVNQMKTKKRK